MKRIDRDLAALAAMPLVQLRERWTAIENSAVPSVPEGLLRRLIAQRLQEGRYGSLPSLVVRELERVESGKGQAEPPLKTQALMPGARLIREWNGKIVAVEVRDDGFVWEDRSYRSLSQIARAVTGAHWSGPRFFGLRSRG